MKHISVTDHAVLRYLERVKGVDIEAVRDHIAGLCKGVQIARAVRAENMEFVIKDCTVVSVIPVQAQNPRKVPKDNHKRREVISA